MRICLTLFFALMVSHAAVAGMEKPVGLFLLETRAEAEKKGVSPALFDKIFYSGEGFTPIQRIIELDQKQPEGTKTFSTYLSQVVSPARISEGRQRYAENKALVDRIANEYGVPAPYLIALWGIETNYGKNTGGFSVPNALATLAYEGRREAFFKDELIKSLIILQQGHITYDLMKGSWAGAMGQCQFMPSSFLNFAVDEDKDGHKDIWTTQADVFASIANYLKQSGWNSAVGWGFPVKIPQNFDTTKADITHFAFAREWTKLGITLPNGAPLPVDNNEYALMFPGDTYEGAYLISRNYPVFLKWNRSRYFATAVGTLADGVAGR